MDISTLITGAQELSKRLETVKTTTSKEVVEDYEIEIERKKNELKKADMELARQIDQLKGQRKLLDLTLDVLKTDKQEARNLLFSLIEEKRLTMTNSKVQPHETAQGNIVIPSINVLSHP